MHTVVAYHSPPRAVGTRRWFSPQQLHSQVKGTLRLLAGLEKAKILELAEALSGSEGNADFVKDVESLQQQLTALLREIAARQQAQD